MSIFSLTITDFWRAQFLNGDILHSDDIFTVTADPDLDEDCRVMVLETVDGRGMAVLTPELAVKAGLRKRQGLSIAAFRNALTEAGVTLHGADRVFHFTEAEKKRLMLDEPAAGPRRLSSEDKAVFTGFQAQASEQDLDGAFVELDHWLVFGLFEQDRLVCAASMYPWMDGRVADLGVLTLEPFRGKGHARKVVRSISRHAWELGYEPQYRCQPDNAASILLASKAGLELFGTWEVVSPDSVV
ncbi:GNAT family N-acetyltransferase [Devosia sp.]|uniref:GNAT family N-acetyltransferase n=1 Tax=Devosia sp. TaxID=1871048 RepID=UPI002FC5C79F